MPRRTKRKTDTACTSGRSLRQDLQFSGDLTTSDAVAEFLATCKMAMQHTKALMVDLTNVNAADTKLVAALVILKRWAKSIGVEIQLRVPQCVRHWLTVCRLESIANPE